MVAPSRGHLVWVTMSEAACIRVRPFCIPIKIPSTTTMALSTSIPSAITKAPREIRCKSIASHFMKTKVPNTVNSKIKPIKSPERNPIKNSSTIITMATDSPKLSTNPLTDLSTSVGWLYTVSISIPTGCCSFNSARRCSTFFPTSTTLTPETKEIPTLRACLPLKLIKLSGISLNPRLISATSRR